MSDPIAQPPLTTETVPLVPYIDRHHGCGGVFAATTITKTESMCGLSATVERRVMRCSKCELDRRAPDQVEADYLGVMAAIRETHGLLTPPRIRAIREALGVTPDEFDALIGLPSGITKGWETMRHLQNPAADRRIRALEDVEYAKSVAIGARVTLRLTEEERAAFRPPAFGKRREARLVAEEAAADGAAPGERPVEIPVVASGDER
jgi:hypothetical protein